MQVVIDIDDNLYTRLFDNGENYVADMRRACVAIRKGVTLPKGHGRLIDADEFEKTADKKFECITSPLLNHIQTYDVYNLLEAIPTIIEADKAESEE